MTNTQKFPTSDEDSSTPDPTYQGLVSLPCNCFRPLTRIHLLLTLNGAGRGFDFSQFPTSDEDSSTPDLDGNDYLDVR